ncbi:uncharacterized protein F4807DRAFT_458361 [Annulohypoxylon truncatum]|uniref:uncharacterized protein n=1 Tax=Annulohypoxylon truncatum TaxID=327061 RepID=UPI002007DF87|nr:uncharacterized protein F4807DRAFT_458361 [Annulohypoxylon truncatum]KAI1211467.1 hypothetical protein F4807DRAFT_458361 [Annulohypoxylon truncatum]
MSNGYLPSHMSCMTQAEQIPGNDHLLTSLWRSREVQRSWSPVVVLHIGQLLIDAHVSASHVDSAVALADILYYDVRQSRGSLDTHSLAFAHKLSVLLTRRRGDGVVVDKWGAVDVKKDREVTYAGPTTWSLVVEKETVKRDLISPAKERCGWHSRGPATVLEGVLVAVTFRGDKDLNPPVFEDRGQYAIE